MKKSTFYCLLAALCLYFNAPGQGQVRPLRIGDDMPTVQFTNVLNHLTGSLSLPTSNGKAIILDFFATWCGSCVKELPRLAALQDSLQGQLEIWLVSREPREKLEAFLAKRPVAKAFPVVYADTILNRHFPNRLLPHDVWINPQGRVAAITMAEFINPNNLASLVAGKRLALPVKKDMPEYAADIPLENMIEPDQLVWKTVLTRFIDGAGNVSGQQKTEKQLRIFEVNQSPLKLYQFAYSVPARDIMLRVHDTGTILPPEPAGWEWMQQYAYCYELTGSRSTPFTVFRARMQRDLDAGLHYTSYRDSMELPVWTVSVAASGSPFQPVSLVETPGIAYDEVLKQTRFSNLGLAGLVRWLNIKQASQHGGLHFSTDSSNSNAVYNGIIPDDAMQDPQQLAELLTATGISLQCSYQRLPVLVITDGDSKAGR